MSAARRQLMWLWAAAWLRWQLIRVNAGRLFGGRAAAVGGLDYHLDPAETPVEGLNYDPAELPAYLTAKLEATRAELQERGRDSAMAASPRSNRRRRVAALATAALLGVSAVGAGAAALVTGSTGVPAVDRLLGIYEAELDDPDRGGRGPGSDFAPRTHGSSSIEVPRNGAQDLVSSSYIARDENVCTALTGVDGAASGPIGVIACVSPFSLASRLARHEGLISAVNADDDHAIVTGFVSGDVASLRGQGPNGSLDIYIGRWRSDIPAVGPLRPFVALGDLDLPGRAKGSNGSDPLRLLNPANYTFDAVMESGTRVRIAP